MTVVLVLSDRAAMSVRNAMLNDPSEIHDLVAVEILSQQDGAEPTPVAVAIADRVAKAGAAAIA